MRLEQSNALESLEVEPDGAISVRVAAADFWDLVEYLSYHRPNVSFTFVGPDYVARFVGTSAATVRAILAEWKKVVDREAVLAGSSS